MPLDFLMARVSVFLGLGNHQLAVPFLSAAGVCRERLLPRRGMTFAWRAFSEAVRTRMAQKSQRREAPIGIGLVIAVIAVDVHKTSRQFGFVLKGVSLF